MNELMTREKAEKATLRRVGTVRIRDQNGSAVIPIEEAINQSGNAGGDGIKFRRGGDYSLIGRVVDNEEVTGDPDVSIDGRKHELTRAINRFGAGETKSVAIPTPGLEHLGIDADDIRAGAEVDLHVCTDPEIDVPVIEVTRPIVHTHQSDIRPVLEDGESE